MAKMTAYCERIRKKSARMAGHVRKVSCAHETGVGKKLCNALKKVARAQLIRANKATLQGECLQAEKYVNSASMAIDAAKMSV